MMVSFGSSVYAEIFTETYTDSFEGKSKKFIESRSGNINLDSCDFINIILQKNTTSGKMTIAFVNINEAWLNAKELKIKIDGKVSKVPGARNGDVGMGLPAIIFDPSPLKQQILKAKNVSFRIVIAGYPHKADFDIPSSMLSEWKQIIKK